MFISASRRTDIPAFYSEWFFKRLDSGFAYVRNPVNPRRVSKVALTPDKIDGFVFWTKDPTPMLPKLDRIGTLPYYFQFTLNPYGTDIEPNVPSKQDSAIPAFRRLSDMTGPGRVIWRYDPIILSSRYTVEHHIKYFEKLAARLAPYTRKCIISFLDMYRNTAKHMHGIELHEITQEDMEKIAAVFSEIASTHGLMLETCAEKVDLSKYGIGHGHCIDASIFSEITGFDYSTCKDKNQRPECGCAASIDIGAYDCCPHGCSYCYATHNPAYPAKDYALHDPESPLLIGSLRSEDQLSERDMFSEIIRQPRFDI